MVLIVGGYFAEEEAGEENEEKTKEGKTNISIRHQMPDMHSLKESERSFSCPDFGVGVKLKATLPTRPLSWLRNSSSRSWSLVLGIGVVWPTESHP